MSHVEGRDDGISAESSGGVVHNQSVLKAVALIGCFVGSNGGKTLTELARRTGMNVSTAYRMLQTLTRTGVLRRNEGEELYFVGPLLLALAGSTFSSSGYGLLLDVLKGVAEETTESASVGIRDSHCAVVLLSASSPQQLRFEHRAGERLPIHCSAMGKVLMAAGRETIPESVASLGRLHPLTPKSIVRSDRLITELNITRQRGYALSDEEQHLGVRSVAVAISRPGELPRAAISVEGPAARMTEERIETIVAALRTAADLISQLPILDRLPET